MKPVHEEISDLLAEVQEDPFSSPVEARKKAMDFLARREYGQAELIKKLAAKGFALTAAERAVIQLTDDGLQSDQRFAENFVQSRVNQGKGPVRIRMDLEQRGIAAEAVSVALEASATDWYQLARDTKQKKFGEEQATDFKARAQQMRFLQYRGFESDHIRAAVAADDD